MKIWVNRSHVKFEHRSVSFVHRGLTISAAEGPDVPFDVIVFPEDEDKAIPLGIQVAEGPFRTIPDAIKAVDKIADAIELGLIVLEDRDA